MDQQTLARLTEMGIDVWQPRDALLADNAAESAAIAPQTDVAAGNNWTELKQSAMNCTACELHCSRRQVVFGVGNQQADVMVVGEAPGYHEDQQGEPFVGRAGQLLTNMLLAIGLERETIYIANILKCRPPNNRDPKPEEVRQCTPFLTQQIELIQPKVICAVGRIAAHFLLDTDQPLGKLRQQTHHYGPLNTPLIVTYHPAYLLRSPEAKHKAYQDVVKMKQLTQITGC